MTPSSSTKRSLAITSAALFVISSVSQAYSFGLSTDGVCRQLSMSSSAFATSGREGIIQSIYIPTAVATLQESRQCRGYMEMKKGKSRIPPQMRGNYKQQQKFQEMREKATEAQRPGADGLPVFNLFVRSKVANVWYPAGSFKGDDKSAGLAKNYSDGNLLAGLSKKQLDEGVGGSLARDLTKLQEGIFRGYPQLRKSRGQLEYGYKLAYEGLSEDKKKMNIVKPEKKEGIIENVKGFFGK